MIELNMFSYRCKKLTEYFKFVGGLGSGCNVFMLRIWRKHGGAGPWMHGMHFAFGLGATLGPIVASPFLRQGQGDDEPFGITTLYPIVGSIACLCGLSFLFKGIYDAMSLATEPEEVIFYLFGWASHHISLFITTFDFT